VLRRDAKIELIKRVPLFAHCSKSELGSVALVADEIDMPEGKVLTTEGDPGREFFVLVEGTADVRRKGRKVNAMGSGDFFGEIALVTKMPRTATVTATSNVRVLVINERDFAALLKSSPEVGRGVAEALAERIAPELPV